MNFPVSGKEQKHHDLYHVPYLQTRMECECGRNYAHIVSSATMNQAYQWCDADTAEAHKVQTWPCLPKPCETTITQLRVVHGILILHAVLHGQVTTMNHIALRSMRGHWAILYRRFHVCSSLPQDQPIDLRHRGDNDHTRPVPSHICQKNHFSLTSVS